MTSTEQELKNTINKQHLRGPLSDHNSAQSLNIKMQNTNSLGDLNRVNDKRPPQKVREPPLWKNLQNKPSSQLSGVTLMLHSYEKKKNKVSYTPIS